MTINNFIFITQNSTMSGNRPCELSAVTLVTRPVKIYLAQIKPQLLYILLNITEY